MTEPLHPADVALVRAAAADAEARAKLLARLGCIERILAYRNVRLGNRLGADDLADAAQEVHAIVWARLQQYDGSAAIESWVYGICEFHLRNALRKRQRRGVAVSLDGGGIDVPDDDAGLPMFDDVYACLGRLAAPELAIVRSRHFDGLTFEESAARLATNVNTLKARYYRAIEQLKQCLAPGRRELQEEP